MVADIQKLLLRAFNAECDDIVEHVRYNNIESSEKRITASRDAILSSASHGNRNNCRILSAED